MRTSTAGTFEQVWVVKVATGASIPGGGMAREALSMGWCYECHQAGQSLPSREERADLLNNLREKHL